MLGLGLSLQVASVKGIGHGAGFTLGSELITNGNFSSSVGWTVAASQSIAGGKLNMGTTLFAETKRAWDTPPVSNGDRFRCVIVVDSLGDSEPHIDIGPTWDTTQHLAQALSLGTNTFDFTVVAISNGTEQVKLQNYLAGATQAVIDSISLRQIL